MSSDSTYWKSLRELHNGNAVSEQKAREFMAGVTDDFSIGDLSTMSRKQFLALLTASAAFAATGCSNYRDKGEIVPYTRKPEEVIPGIANSYASTCGGCPQGCGILIKTREGRPIKIDGNPDHPVNRGKICTKGQASILNLYDPNRLRSPQYGSSTGKMDNLTWLHADEEIVRRLQETARVGQEIAIITRGITSPTTMSVLEEFRTKYPSTRIYSFEPFGDMARRNAWERCYNNAELPVIEWERASVILALEADFLGTDGMTIEQIRAFTSRRDIMQSDNFNRLYCVEGSMSLTGANADYRLSLRPDVQLGFVLALLHEILVVRAAVPSPLPLPPAVLSGSLKTFAAAHSLDTDILRHLVDGLLQHRGAAMVYAGRELPEDVHTAVHFLNEVLGNTALYSKAQSSIHHLPPSSPEDVEKLVAGMKSGAIGIIIHCSSNPVYHLPRSFGYAEALPAVPLSMSLTETDDETSRLCTFVLPINNVYESWGDVALRTGLISLQQPVIAPLYDTRQREAAFLTWIRGKDTYRETIYHEYLKARWERDVFPLVQGGGIDFTSFWHTSLHDGAVEFKGLPRRPSSFSSRALMNLPAPVAPSGVTILLTEDPILGDGTFANNGWLQEIPHPISKIVWDNYAALSISTARRLGVGDNDLIDVRTASGAVRLPVFLQAGQADDTISVCFGYGRTNAGPIGTDIGIDVMPLVPKTMLGGGAILTGASVARAEGTYELVSTQEHHSIDDTFVKDFHLRRKIIREGTLEEYRRDPHFLHHEKHELFNIAPSVEYRGVKWAMAIDLNKCIGCNACVAGCSVENNIPVVGKEQVGKGREMQWIRLDRYYSGTAAAPSLSHQPMLCQHCDNAPCENVCPVVATTHSPDGLNQMTYNRCVGTKYCSNNCPYKVRRFNFFNWRDFLADGYYEQEPISLLHNPEVTVRSRGVMEKCTFCVQRIMEARQHAAEQGRIIRGSDVRTACQDACPATAIVFGDMHDPQSEVSRYRSHDLGYHVLEEVNARPNVTYIARLRNTHSEGSA